MVFEFKSPCKAKKHAGTWTLEMRTNGSAITKLKDNRELPFPNCYKPLPMTCDTQANIS